MKSLTEASRQSAWLALLTLHMLDATAHPLDEIVQGAYVTLAPGTVQLELDLTPGTEVVEAVLRSLDANADRNITDMEARTYAQQVLAQSTLSLDGVATTWKLEKISMPAYQNLKLQGDTIKIHAVAARIEEAGQHLLSYDNRYHPVKSQCIANIFFQPGAQWRYHVINQQHSNDGRQLTVQYTGSR